MRRRAKSGRLAPKSMPSHAISRTRMPSQPISPPRRLRSTASISSSTTLPASAAATRRMAGGREFDIDVMATVRASNAAIPHIERSGGGAIVNISSISGLGASARTASYAAVKAAVINYTLSQGLMLAPKKIRVNAIAPGSIEFPGGLWETNKTTNPQLYNAVFKSDSVGPHGQAGRGCERGAVSLQRPGVVDHRTDPDGRWRPVARLIGLASAPGSERRDERAIKMVPGLRPAWRSAPTRWLHPGHEHPPPSPRQLLLTYFCKRQLSVSATKILSRGLNAM